MDFYGDYHIHTTYSDGVNSIEGIAQTAIALGLKQIAITDHGFSNKYMSLTPRKFSKEVKELQKVRTSYPQIDILQGIEANIIDTNGTVDLNYEQMDKLDILVAGFHRFADSTGYRQYVKYIMYNGFISKVFKPSDNIINRNTEAYIRAIAHYPIDVLAHINEHAKVDAHAVCEVAAEYGTIIELNVRHMDLIEESIEEMLKTQCKFIVNSDAHKPEKIGKLEAILPLIEKYQIPKDRIVNLGKKPEFTRLNAYKATRRNG